VLTNLHEGEEVFGGTRSIKQFHPEPFLFVLQNQIDLLGNLQNQHRNKLYNYENTVRRYEVEHQQRLQQLNNTIDGIILNFQKLEKRVNRIIHVSMSAGQSIETASQAQDQARFAQFVIRCFLDLNTGDLSRVDPILTSYDERRIVEAGQLIQLLQNISDELNFKGGSSSRPRNRGMSGHEMDSESGENGENGESGGEDGEGGDGDVDGVGKKTTGTNNDQNSIFTQTSVKPPVTTQLPDGGSQTVTVVVNGDTETTTTTTTTPDGVTTTIVETVETTTIQNQKDSTRFGSRFGIENFEPAERTIQYLSERIENKLIEKFRMANLHKDYTNAFRYAEVLYTFKHSSFTPPLGSDRTFVDAFYGKKFLYYSYDILVAMRIPKQVEKKDLSSARVFNIWFTRVITTITDVLREQCFLLPYIIPNAIQTFEDIVLAVFQCFLPRLIQQVIDHPALSQSELKSLRTRATMMDLTRRAICEILCMIEDLNKVVEQRQAEQRHQAQFSHESVTSRQSVQGGVLYQLSAYQQQLQSTELGSAIDDPNSLNSNAALQRSLYALFNAREAEINQTEPKEEIVQVSTPYIYGYLAAAMQAMIAHNNSDNNKESKKKKNGQDILSNTFAKPGKKSKKKSSLNNYTSPLFSKSASLKTTTSTNEINGKTKTTVTTVTTTGSNNGRGVGVGVGVGDDDDDSDDDDDDNNNKNNNNGNNDETQNNDTTPGGNPSIASLIEHVRPKSSADIDNCFTAELPPISSILRDNIIVAFGSFAEGWFDKEYNYLRTSLKQVRDDLLMSKFELELKTTKLIEDTRSLFSTPKETLIQVKEMRRMWLQETILDTEPVDFVFRLLNGALKRAQLISPPSKRPEHVDALFSLVSEFIYSQYLTPIVSEAILRFSAWGSQLLRWNKDHFYHHPNTITYDITQTYHIETFKVYQQRIANAQKNPYANLPPPAANLAPATPLPRVRYFYDMTPMQQDFQLHCILPTMTPAQSVYLRDYWLEAGKVQVNTNESKLSILKKVVGKDNNKDDNGIVDGDNNNHNNNNTKDSKDRLDDEKSMLELSSDEITHDLIFVLTILKSAIDIDKRLSSYLTRVVFLHLSSNITLRSLAQVRLDNTRSNLETKIKQYLASYAIHTSFGFLSILKLIPYNHYKLRSVDSISSSTTKVTALWMQASQLLESAAASIIASLSGTNIDDFLQFFIQQIITRVVSRITSCGGVSQLGAPLLLQDLAQIQRPINAIGIPHLIMKMQELKNMAFLFFVPYNGVRNFLAERLGVMAIDMTLVRTLVQARSDYYSYKSQLQQQLQTFTNLQDRFNKGEITDVSEAAAQL
jgi:hypothetical protein